MSLTRLSTFVMLLIWGLGSFSLSPPSLGCTACARNCSNISTNSSSSSSRKKGDFQCDGPPAPLGELQGEVNYKRGGLQAVGVSRIFQYCTSADVPQR